MNLTHIYALYDPLFPDEYRYVGKTIQEITKRRSQHLSQGKYNPEFALWVKELRRAGRKPSIILLATVLTLEWKWWERFMVADYRSKGHRLLNRHPGGGGPVFASDRKKRKRNPVQESINSTIINLTRWADPENREKMSKKITGKKLPPLTEEHKKKISERHTGSKKGPCPEDRKQKISEGVSRNYKEHPEILQQAIENRKKASQHWTTEEGKKQRGELMAAYWSSPEGLKRREEKSKEMTGKPGRNQTGRTGAEKRKGKKYGKRKKS